MIVEKIRFKVSYGGVLHTITTQPREYINLMTLLNDKVYPLDFGECGGVGRCGTCLVKLDGDVQHLFVGKEANTLEKMGVKDPNVRLACQIQIDDNLNNIVITILSGY